MMSIVLVGALQNKWESNFIKFKIIISDTKLTFLTARRIKNEWEGMKFS